MAKNCYEKMCRKNFCPVETWLPHVFIFHGIFPERRNRLSFYCVCRSKIASSFPSPQTEDVEDVYEFHLYASCQIKTYQCL